MEAKKKMGSLALGFNDKESIKICLKEYIGEDIVVTLRKTNRSGVKYRLVFDAPRDIKITRIGLLERFKKEDT